MAINSLDSSFRDPNQDIDDLEFLASLSEQDQLVLEGIMKKKKEIADKYPGSNATLLNKDPSELTSQELGTLGTNDSFLKDRQELDLIKNQEKTIMGKQSEYRSLYSEGLKRLEAADANISEASKRRVRALAAKFEGIANAANATAVQDSGARSVGLRAAAEIEAKKQEPINQEIANRNDSLAANAGQQAAALQTEAEAVRNQEQFKEDVALKRDQLAEQKRQFNLNLQLQGLF